MRPTEFYLKNIKRNGEHSIQSQRNSSRHHNIDNDLHKNDKSPGKLASNPLTEKELNFLEKGRITDARLLVDKLRSSDVFERLPSTRSKLESRHNNSKNTHRRTKTINNTDIGRYRDKSSSNYLNQGSGRKEQLKHKFALDLGRIRDQSFKEGLRNDGSSYKKKSTDGPSTDRSLSKLYNKYRQTDTTIKKSGAMTERGKRDDPFMVTLSKAKHSVVEHEKSNNLEGLEQELKNELIAYRQSKSKPQTDRQHYVGSRSLGDDDLKVILKKSVFDIPTKENNRSYSRLGKSSKDQAEKSNSKKKGRNFALRKIEEGSMTDRGIPNKKMRSKSRLQPSNNNGSISDRRHHRTSSDIVQSANGRQLPKFEQTKIILKKFGNVTGFGVNTHKGCIRNYNEDRVSILLNAQQRFKKILESGFKNCCLFGVYDGHGGSQCCNFLKEYLFTYLLNDSNFTTDTVLSLKRSFKEIDQKFLERIQQTTPLDCSGSCAIVLLVLDNRLYFVNVGDSRAILSQKSGKRVIQCSKDHKPTREVEYQRVFSKQGLIYRVANIKGRKEPQMITARNEVELEKLKLLEKEDCVVYAGPFRVKPGGLSVSRTFGDIEAKVESLGGKENVVSCEPEISSHEIEADDDFVLLASDGIFDTMSNNEIIETIFETLRYFKQRSIDPYREYEHILGECVSNVMKRALIKQSEDNVTVMIICFKNLLDLV